MRKINNIILIIFCINIFVGNNIYAQWFNENTLTATVALEVKRDTSYEAVATGFSLYNYENEDLPIVITAGHVITDLLSMGFNEIYVSLNMGPELTEFSIKNNIKFVIFSKGFLWEIVEGKLRAKIILRNKSTKNYLIHDSLDIGAFLINIESSIPSPLGKDEEFEITSGKVIPNSLIRYKKDVKLGDDVYFIGFPMGFGVDDIISPIIRTAIISKKSKNSFLLDVISLGGNSGSPVFTKRTLNSPTVKIIGMITGAWVDELSGVIVQPDTSKLEYIRKDISQNLGLAVCVWIDDIIDIRNKAIELDIVKNY